MLYLTYFLLALVVCCTGFATTVLLRGMLYRRKTPMLLRVAARTQYGDALLTLRLQRRGLFRLMPLPPFSAGQSISIRLPGQHLARRYSLARWQRVPFAYELAIRLETQGKLTPLLFAQAQPGCYLEVDKPSGEFVLTPSPATHAALIAGGVGITPLLAMLDAMASQSSEERMYRTINLFWQVRYADDLIYQTELMALQQRMPQLQLHFLVSRPSTGEGQYVDIERIRSVVDDVQQCDFYMCAGARLLDGMCATLQAAGVADGQVFFERFGVPQGEHGQWEMHLQGKQIPFDNHPSILVAIESAGVAVPNDCRSGSCGLCQVSVMSGQYRQLVEPEFACDSGRMLACCTVPLSHLELAI